MKRRDFLLGAASLLLFPQDVFAKTVVSHERTFGRKKPERIDNNTFKEPHINEPPEMPNVKQTDLILMRNDVSEREATNRIIIHHTGNKTDLDMSAKDAHILHKYTFGWAGVGYHYIIRKDGSIEACRPEHLIGAHALSNNDDSIGIALSGNLNMADPTELQLKSLISLSAYLANKYALDLNEPGVLIGHRDVNKTACPGVNMYYRLDSIRRYAVQNL